MDLNVDQMMKDIVNSELGSDATLTTASPSESKSIRVDFRSTYDDKGTEIIYEGKELYADAVSSDVVNVKQNDTLTVSGTVYKIASTQPDGAGMTRLILSKTS